MLGRIVIATLAAALGTALAADSTHSGVPVQIVLTLAHHHHANTSTTFTKEDLIITQGYEPLAITKVVPLEGAAAELEMYLLVDDCSSCEFGPKFDELRRFISMQAETTAVGVAYIRNGTLQVIERPTKDRARTIQALTVPSGNKPANQFDALADLVKAWPQNSTRHVVLMITNGIDPDAKDELQDGSADRAIEAAESAGVIVYMIYHPSADYATSDPYQIHTGQVHLSHVAYETGGEAYFLGLEPLMSLKPFLSDINDHLLSQYEVEFLARSGEAAGFQSITVKSRIAGQELMAPEKVWVPAAVHKSKTSAPEH